MGAPALLALVLLVSAPPLQSAPPQERVAEIRVHGNLTLSDQDVVQMAAVRIGEPVTASMLDDVAARLRATKRFQHVEVLKRFASIEDPTQIVLVIIVDEGAVKIELTGDPNHPSRTVRTHAPRIMYFPLLTAEDGYGVTYGMQFAVPDPLGKGTRLSMPLTWGGDKRAQIELQKDFEHAVISRMSVGTSISRRTHPFFEADEDRGQIWGRAERDVTHTLRVGATAGWDHESFLGSEDRFAHIGGDVVFDTRIDPMLARNAVYGRAAWEHLAVADGINQTQLDGRGYIGLFGQTVLVVRGLRDDADKPRPAYLEPMLGGIENLRGFRTGTAIGDTLVATSAELRVPITSPLSIGKMGVMAFVDSGTVYNEGQRLADQTFKHGIGGGVWFSAAFVRFNVAVAHGLGASTRVHVGGSLSF